MAYDNTNRGVLFVNDRKEKDTQPDRTGTLNVDGVEYFLDGWLKTSESGRQFLSVSVKRKDKQPQAAQEPRNDRPATPAARTHGDRVGGPKNRPVAASTGTGFDEMDDDIPF
jgi:hypothetical protein